MGLISLGCAKALVDSELILTKLRAEGYRISSNYSNAHLVIVNTCGFIKPAIEESLDAIGEAIAKHGKVIVTGCLGAKAQLIQDTHPQVLAITGPHAYNEVLEAVHSLLPPPVTTAGVPSQSIKLTPSHYAYVKIAEGCDHKCSFCIIPQLRGPLQSRSLSSILQEAQQLVDNGVRELLIIAQDTGAYGRDLKHKLDFYKGRPLQSNIATLATELSKLTAWIRLHYLYPYPELNALVELMAADAILPYLDIPLQHISSKILRAMRRPAASERILQRLAKWRQMCPNLVIRSTFIVGFPGETDADFVELIDFLQAAQLDRVGCFTYSAVSGAPANTMELTPVPDQVKQERYAEFMRTQANISRKILANKVGQHMVVLVDRVESNQVVARSAGDAPEIDGTVLIDGSWDIAPGDFIEVIVTGSTDHDLLAQPPTITDDDTIL
ncbi:ribosomal protein S12 methylthiotransferase [Achromatium sp. WMS2]|nr:ribosomal protein S12 methylthiotransferase [Achromatium sp. WMS2]